MLRPPMGAMQDGRIEILLMIRYRSRLNILCLESDISTANAYRERLENAGYRIDWTSARDASDFSNALSPGFDVILCGCTPPAFSAVEALACVKSVRHPVHRCRCGRSGRRGRRSSGSRSGRFHPPEWARVSDSFGGKGDFTPRFTRASAESPGTAQ